MILQALTNYYEMLLKKSREAPEQMEGSNIAPPGRSDAKVSFALELTEDGQLKNIISLKKEVQAGKKMVWRPASRMVPQVVKRSSGIASNFLCDNAKYLLGIDTDGCNTETLKRFQDAKIKHLSILEGVPGKTAEAIRCFFQTWEPDQAKNCQPLMEKWEDITDGSNLVFAVDGLEAQEDEAIMQAWDKWLEKTAQDGENAQTGICLVTGKTAEIERIHAAIKGVQGAQSSGAALVSFNASAFESYGKEQSYNAPVGKYAAFAYATALNYLLSQKNYVLRVGDTSIVYWAENAEKGYQDAFSWAVDPKPNKQEIVRSILENITKGRMIQCEGIELDQDTHFYILGLAPNAARLSVRFFYQDNFGSILEHVKAHYRRLQIVKPSWETKEYLGVWSLLSETVNPNAKDKSAAPNMAAAVLRSILSGSPYPASLYSNTLIRIRAEQGEGKISYGRAAIIKAYLMRNYNWEEGEKFVALNTETMNQAYVLGRLFAVLEEIQEAANPGINTTIKDRYFNAACTTPGVVFPILLRLKNSHIRKIDSQGKKIRLEQMMTDWMGRLNVFPHRLSLEEQGEFMLGYYHQVQKRYEKKEER